jgi:hypothetical protein
MDSPHQRPQLIIDDRVAILVEHGIPELVSTRNAANGIAADDTITVDSRRVAVRVWVERLQRYGKCRRRGIQGGGRD